MIIKKTFVLLLTAFLFASAVSAYGSYATQSYSNSHGYYYQQNYNANYAAHGYNYVSASVAQGQPYYVANRHNYGYNGNGPYLFPSRSYNSLFGSRTTYSSHFYIDNPIDQAYARNPSMLEPRRMQNNMRSHKGFYIN